MSYEEFMALDDDARKERYEDMNLCLAYCTYCFGKFYHYIDDLLSKIKEQP